MFPRIRTVITRLSQAAGGTLLLLLLGVWLVAQQPTVGVFSRIYMGGTGAANPQIRWGAADPVAPCSKGSLYLQTTNAVLGGVLWLCQATNVWGQILDASHVGNDFYADAAVFGATCDGSTDDTAAIQATITAAYLFGKSGHVVLPPGVCNITGINLGPITIPWEVSPDDPLFHAGVGLDFNAPRAATVHFTAASSAISWTGSTITSADVGNQIFYGPSDAQYAAVGVTRVTRPTYACTITAVLSGTTGTCVATPYNWQVGPPLATTTGDQAVYITDDHNFTIDDTVFNATPATLSPDHVGKSIVFPLPVLRAPLDFDNLPRTGSHVILEPVPAPCTNTPATDDWQCLQPVGMVSKFFAGIITTVTDPTHGKLQFSGLSDGSSAPTRFPDYPVHGAQGGVCGGPDPNCASYPAHEWAHLVSPDTSLLAQNVHIDHLIDLTITSTFNQTTNSHTYLGTIYPYVQPIDTQQRFISMRGASQAGTILRFTGNDTGNAAVIFSKNKYFTLEDLSITNGANGPDQPQTDLAGLAGNVTNGVHGYRVTCTYNGNGFYSMMSSEDQVAVTDKTVDGQVDVSLIPVCGTDPLNQRTIWRTKADEDGTGPWYFLTTIADNVTTTYRDNLADGSLGTPQSELGNTLGMYLGGLPGAGTQALGFQISRVGIGGFNVGLQIGDALGGEASDGDFTLFSVTSNDIGVRVGPGSFNTLDLHFHDIQGGFNKVGLLNYSGNVFVDKGSFSFNAVDYWTNGFGPFRVENMRTEGPGFFLVGGEPGLAVRSNALVEPAGARRIVGDVTATPVSTHDVANVDVSNVSVGVPANSFYPITFTAATITAADLRKIAILPGLGAGGADVIGQIWTVDTATTGTFFSPVAGGVVTAGTVTVTLYDSAVADLTFPTDQLTPNDVGGALALSGATVGSGKAVRCLVTSVTAATTGTCGFFLGGQGAGPVKPGGGTTTNPVFFAYTAAYLDGSAVTGTFENNIFRSGMVTVAASTGGGGGSYVFNNNQVWAPGKWPLTVLGTGKRWVLNADANDAQATVATWPTPTGNTNNGIVFPWTFSDDTNQGFNGSIALAAHGNLADIYGGPVQWPLQDGVWQDLINTNEDLQTLLRPLVTFDSALNPFATFRVPPTGPVAGMQQLSRVKQLSESGYTDGRNLRIQCTFLTADTVTCPFSRSEAFEVRLGVGSPTTFDPATRTYGVNTTADHFTQGDVGKIMLFPACCGDGGVQNLWAYITQIVSSTNIKVRSMAGGNVFPNGITAGTATVGQDEPDALWLPVGLTCSANETFWVDSFDASGITLKSSNATSTAVCRVLVVR